MKKIYKAHILFTKERSHFEVLENGYVAVENGCVTGVSTNLADLDGQNAEVIDFGNCLLIPAMNDMHVHAPQVHNQAVAMDLELLPWLQSYTFLKRLSLLTFIMPSVCTDVSCILNGCSVPCEVLSLAPFIRKVPAC